MKTRQLCLGSALAIIGWFVCAAFCLLLTIRLEAWPQAYDMALPAVLGVLFGNLAVFVFVPLRMKDKPGLLFRAVVRICLVEGLLLLALYFAAKYIAGA
ncbi:MAG: hypothetical protein Q4F27_01895 [Desulfovibrionaceae bacterium]|nr:hypothetical protein [Desulfovibrionaceae bacterium]